MNLKLIEFVYYISPDDVQYPLFGGRRALMSFGGFGMPDIDYISDSGPFVHGERIRDFRLDSRVIDFVLFESACKRIDRWENLGEISNTIRMNRGGAGRILIILEDMTEREIDAWVLSGPLGLYDASGDLKPSDINEPLRFLAPYPIWRDPTETEIIFPGTIDDSCLPFCLDTCIGSAVINSSVDIAYTGTFETFPTIEITGPIATPLIRNATTGKEIQFLYNISLGELVTVELNPDQALVYNNFGDNLIGTIEDTNDLSTFSIEPEGLNVPNGINTIEVLGSGGLLGTTQIKIIYTDKFLSVPQ